MDFSSVIPFFCYEYRKKECKKLEREVEYMCNLSDGVEQKGIEKGKMSTLCDLVRDTLITIEETAKRADMTIDEFEIELNKE